MSNPKFNIICHPDFNAVAPGAVINLYSDLVNSEEEVPEGTMFSWICYNDPATTRFFQSSTFTGPTTRHWNEASWDFSGFHTIVLTVTFPDGSRHKYIRHQRVDSATNILRAEFDPDANNGELTPVQTLVQTKQYLAVLEAIADEKPPSTDEEIEAHEKTVSKIESYVAHLGGHLEGVDANEAFQVDAIHLDEKQSTRTILKLWLVNTTEINQENSDEMGAPTWRLIDWTNPIYRSTTGCYEESGDTHEEAINNLLDKWDRNNRYPEGRVRYDFKVPKYNIDLVNGFDSDGMSTWDEISQWLDYVALGAAIVAGIVTLIAPVPGSRVVSAAIWASIFTSTAAATINIAQRHTEGFGNLKDGAFDGLTIVGNLFAGVGVAWKVGATVTSASRLGSGMSKAVIIGQISTDGIQGVLMSVDQIVQYNQIMDDPNLQPDERLKRLMELFRSLAIAGAITYISIKGSTTDLDNLNNNKALLNKVDFENPNKLINLDETLEQSVPIREGQTEVKTQVQIEPEVRALRIEATLDKDHLKIKNDYDVQFRQWLANNPNRRLPNNIIFGGKLKNGKATIEDKNMRNDIRSEVSHTLPRFSDLNEGNIAFASVAIDGKNYFYKAFSGNEVEIPGFVRSTSKQDQLLPSQVYKGHNRWSDTEQKILEKIIRITDENSSGVLRLFSERQICGSCESVIKRFAAIRPNIQLEIVVSRVGKATTIDGKAIKNTFMND